MQKLIKFDYSEYLVQTAHLGLTEHGAYWRLLLHYYQHQKPLPGATDQIYRIARANSPEDRRTVDYVLEQFFTFEPNSLDGGGVWRSKKADRDMARQKRGR